VVTNSITITREVAGGQVTVDLVYGSANDALGDLGRVLRTVRRWFRRPSTGGVARRCCGSGTARRSGGSGRAWEGGRGIGLTKRYRPPSGAANAGFYRTRVSGGSEPPGTHQDIPGEGDASSPAGLRFASPSLRVIQQHRYSTPGGAADVD
jgi:hypothetical protein